MSNKMNLNYTAEFLGTFLGFSNPDNIEAFFNKKYQTWLWRNSSSTEVKGKQDIDNYFILQYDEKGNIINGSCSGTTKDGILLNEKDFIKKEILKLDRLENSDLDLDRKKRIEFYKDFLSKRLETFILDQNEDKENITEKEVTETYPYPEVFRNKFAFDLFNRLYETKKDTRYQLAEFSFIYRMMVEDGLLQDHQKPEVFKNWLAKEPYYIIVEYKLKTLDNCTSDFKMQQYSDAKELIKLQTKV